MTVEPVMAVLAGHAVSIGPDFTCAVGSCFDLVQEKRKKDEDTRLDLCSHEPRS